MGSVPVAGGALVAASSVMALSGGGAARSPAVCRLCVVTNGGAMAVDRVSILPSVMCSAACVAGVVNDGVCRRQACVVAGVDGTRRVCTEEVGVWHRRRRSSVFVVEEEDGTAACGAAAMANGVYRRSRRSRRPHTQVY
jgi:hypothetical protein